MPDAIARYFASDIALAHARHSECQNCLHQPDKVAHCYAYQLSYDGSLLRLAANNCPYAKALAQQKRYEAGYQKLMIAPRFAERTLQNFVPSPVTQRIYQYCLSFVANYQEHQKGLYFYGGYGSGKTHLAVGILRALYETKHVAGTFLVTSSFFDQLKASFGDGKKFAETFQFAANAPLLVLDDLGEGRKDKNGMLSEWTREELFLLVNSRYEKKLTTIFTSKYGIEQIAAITGKAIASRLMEMCVFVHNRAGDYRAKAYQVIE